MSTRRLVLFTLLVFTFHLSLCARAVYAQATPPATLAGVVTDADSGAPIPGANVMVLGTTRGAATDAEGRFTLEVLGEGEVTVRARYVGYEAAEEAVPLEAGTTVHLALALRPTAVRLGGIEVSALRPDLRPQEGLGRTKVREANPRDSGELMRALAGVEAVRRGPVGLDPVVRGLRETEVGVYLDGTRIFPGGPARMDSPLSHLDPSAIQSIEVVKGPYALTWGAGNMSAVRVDTYDPWEGPNGLVHGRLSSGYDTNFGAFEEAAALHGRSGPVAYQVSSAFRDGDDYRTGAGGDVPADFRSWEGRGTVGYAFTPRSRLSVSAGYQGQDDIDYPGRLLDADHFHTTNLSVRYRWEGAFGAGLRAVEGLAYVNDVQHGMDNDGKPTAQPDPDRMPPFPLDVRVDASVRVTGGRLAAEWVPARDWHLEVGGDLYSADREATRRIWRNDEQRMLLFEDLMWPDARITDAGAFVRAERSLGDHLRTAGTLRLDQVWADADTASAFLRENVEGPLDASETNLSAALTVSLLPAAHWTLSLGAGSVVRTADASERYADRIPASKAQTSAEFVGTPGLQPERSTQGDLWIEAAYPRVSLSLSAFARRIDNYVTLAPTDLPKRLPLSPPTVYRYVNGTAAFWGAEARLGYALLPAWTADASGSYLWGQDETVGEPALGVAPPRLGAGLRYEPEERAYFAEGRVHVVAEQARVAAARGEQPTSGYVTADLKAGLTLGPTALQFGVTNVFDRAYTDHLNAKNPFSGVPIAEPGRVFFIDATYRF